MAKQFKDFLFKGKKLSDLLIDYICVDFDQNEGLNGGLSRSMETSETNRYRREKQDFYDQWDDVIEFNLDIMKNPCTNTNLEITSAEKREFNKWLTYGHSTDWIQFKYDGENSFSDIRYRGYFSKIPMWDTAGKTYGLRLTFTCVSPFAYTGEIKKSISCTSSKEEFILCDTDDDFVYPKITFKPKANGYACIWSRTDGETLYDGSSSTNITMSSLSDLVEAYAKSEGCDVEYIYPSGSAYFVQITDIGFPFYMVDKYTGEKDKCFAVIGENKKTFKVLKSGFLYMYLYKDLDVYMDCKKLTIVDSIGRMVSYSKLGIQDVDNMYWLRLVDGSNDLIFRGNCDFEISYVEARKVGE